MNNLWILGVLGAGAGVAILCPLGAERQRLTQPTRWFGWWATTATVSVLLIAMQHGRALPAGFDAVLLHAANMLCVLAWWLALRSIRSAVGGSPSWFETRACYAVLGVGYVFAVNLSRSAKLPFVVIVLIGAASVAMATYMLRGTKSDVGTPQSARMFAKMFLAFLVVLLLAQTIRTVWPSVASLREVVPVVLTMTFLWYSMSQLPRATNEEQPVISLSSRYAHSSLLEDAAKHLYERIEADMEQRRLYRDSQLSAVSLGRYFEVTPRHISQAINQFGNRTWPEYLMHWRVRAAKQELSDVANDCYTMDAIVERSGFSSRSAFYRAFRQIEGMTPTDFRQHARATAMRVVNES